MYKQIHERIDIVNKQVKEGLNIQYEDRFQCTYTIFSIGNCEFPRGLVSKLKNSRGVQTWQD